MFWGRARSLVLNHNYFKNMSYYKFFMSFLSCVTDDSSDIVLVVDAIWARISNSCRYISSNCKTVGHILLMYEIPDSKVHGANMGPICGRQDPGGPHVGHMNFVIWDHYKLWAGISSEWRSRWTQFRVNINIDWLTDWLTTSSIPFVVHRGATLPLSTWINLNPSMDMWLYPLHSMGWNTVMSLIEAPGATII